LSINWILENVQSDCRVVPASSSTGAGIISLR